ncbi:hypothetical protein EN45_098070 [Penicillium chrysogenum]|uniref:Zn(2)-C6 fungal-type domain-containing protein n=1 Tax=Penicillium chrysogenum TaxID=5076 RepID=A0A167R6J5_PENCH|nr:hypothetical protein EN45_098070 [Penicillium chrysogenum]
MRQSLRRSCAACARSKSSCDLRTPRCSRCIKRQVECAYANEPSTGPATSGWQNGASTSPLDESGTLTNYRFGSLDPFDSYPQTRLPREHVQRLIYGFLHKIAFQYYPLDLNATSNPFLVSWWPLALGDPALFHVSLQTACLDEELLAQKGFQTSELLMVDSVALLRRKVEYMSLAVQDGTMNSVITLATIEAGRHERWHQRSKADKPTYREDGQLVSQAPSATKRTAIDISQRVSMLIMGHPQFETQDDFGIGDGIPPIPEWQFDSTALDNQSLNVSTIEVDYAVNNVFNRLRNIFQRARSIPLPATQLHDLTCFVIHRLLLSAPATAISPSSPTTESIRYGIILYMFIAQGPTYYSHAVIQNTIVIRFMEHLEHLASTRVYESLDVWFAAVGLVASAGTAHHGWFMKRAQDIAAALQLGNFGDTLTHIKTVLWLEKPQSEDLFRSHWDTIFDFKDQS